MKYYFTIFLILFYFQTVSSKDGIYIYDINSENYPKVSLKFYNEINSQSKELKKENINLLQKNLWRRIQSSNSKNHYIIS